MRTYTIAERNDGSIVFMIRVLQSNASDDEKPTTYTYSYAWER